MAREWGKVKADAVASGLLDEQRVAERAERLRAAQRAYRLREIRRSRGTNQEDLAKAMHVSQSRVSRIERGELDRAELATLRSYVEALGGRVEIIADFGDERLVVG
jgi:DNA-binding XRE family transcriptional regulator